MLLSFFSAPLELHEICIIVMQNDEAAHMKQNERCALLPLKAAVSCLALNKNLRNKLKSQLATQFAKGKMALNPA